MPPRLLAARAFCVVSLFTATPALAQPDVRDVVHDARGQVVRSTFGDCVRIRWVGSSDICRMQAQLVQPTPRREIAQEERTVYFEFDKARLMESEWRKVDSLADILKSERDIQGVQIVGYADRIGSESYNDRLSQRRARTVESYLKSRGYLNTTIAKTRWLGESVPVTKCPDGLSRSELIACLQRDRRVEVEIEYLQAAPAAQTH